MPKKLTLRKSIEDLTQQEKELLSKFAEFYSEITGTQIDFMIAKEKLAFLIELDNKLNEIKDSKSLFLKKVTDPKRIRESLHVAHEKYQDDPKFKERMTRGYQHALKQINECLADPEGKGKRLLSIHFDQQTRVIKKKEAEERNLIPGQTEITGISFITFVLDTKFHQIL